MQANEESEMCRLASALEHRAGCAPTSAGVEERRLTEAFIGGRGLLRAVGTIDVSVSAVGTVEPVAEGGRGSRPALAAAAITRGANALTEREQQVPVAATGDRARQRSLARSPERWHGTQRPERLDPQARHAESQREEIDSAVESGWL
jgi:hypothetical protein